MVRAPLAPTAACDVLACAWLARGPGLSRGAAALDHDLVKESGLPGIERGDEDVIAVIADLRVRELERIGAARAVPTGFLVAQRA